MHKRILKTLTIVLVLGIAIPAQAALAKPVSGKTIERGFIQQSVPLLSERSAAMNPRLRQSVPLVTEKSIALNPPSRPSVALVSEKLPGRHVPLSAPTTSLVASTGSGLDWGDAGIGAASVFATMLIGAAGASVLRRYHGRPAH